MLPQDYLEQLEDAMRARRLSEKEAAACRSYADHLLKAGLPVLFDDEHVEKVLRLNEIGQDSYHWFPISQYNGKTRIITAPSRPLKERQRWILREILEHLKISAYAHGFEQAHSIVTNARIHAEHDYVLCLDIRDFFPSIKEETVEGVFRRAGYTSRASKALAEVCCYEEQLPQGAPTSPRLSNIIFRDLDIKLAAIAAKRGAVYSRYADDLTFSSVNDLAGMEEEIRPLLEERGFYLNGQKTRLYGANEPKRITGIIVQNGVLRAPKYFKRKLRETLI